MKKIEAEGDDDGKHIYDTASDEVYKIYDTRV
jgi:hypothetical protein